ncbi:MAG: cytochrome c [Myxococcota bacterium]
MRRAPLLPRPLAAALLGLLLAAPGCGAPEQPPTPAPPSVPETPEPPRPPAAPPAPAPRQGGDPAAGAALYASQCASCHGERGDADGPVAAALDPKPAKHSDGAYMNALSDAYLFQVIVEGGAAVGKSQMMMPWGQVLADDQIRDLVAYVRTLADPPYRAAE